MSQQGGDNFASYGVYGIAATRTRYVVFDVAGTPVPQGSMRSPKAGVVIHNSGEKLKSWRDSIGTLASVHFKGAPHTGPVSVALTFGLKPPQKHEVRPIKKPDLDKLVRAVLDALTSIAYKDDSQVVHIEAEKHYDDRPGLTVEVWLL